MGIALDHLSEDRRREIAGGLFKVTRRDEAKGELHGLCPIHSEQNPSFSYNFKKDVFKCLSCDASGDLASLWGQVRGYDAQEGFKAFCREFGIGADDKRPKKRPDRQKPDKIIPEEEWHRLKPLPETWLKKLKKERGWTQAAAEALDLRLWQNDRGQDKRIAIPVRNDKGQLVNVRLYLPGGKPKVRSWASGYGASRLWPPPGQWRAGEPVWLCEGEPDAITAVSQGLNAVTQTAGAGTWKDEFNRAFKGRDVVVAYDADLKGRQGAEKAARQIARTAKLVRIIDWPEFMLEDGQLPPDHGQDLTDFFVRQGRSPGDLMDLLAGARTVDPPAPEEDRGPRRFFGKGATGRSRVFRPRLLAEEIMAEHDLLTDAEKGISYRWNGRFWEKIEPALIRKMARRKLGLESTTARANDVLGEVLDLSAMDAGQEMNSQPHLICLKNGMFDLESFRILPHRKDYLATYQLDVAFDPRTPEVCPGWMKFLERTVQVGEVIEELQEFSGYCLTRETIYHKALLLLGPGEDGKSTYLNILTALVGEENTANVDMASLEDQFHRASLVNKVLNVYTEVEAQTFTSGYFKSIVSGDRINAAFKHQPVFEFRPYCKLAFSANRFPKILDNSHGFFRRVLPIRFRHRFSDDEKDAKLFQKLLPELPGIFGWAVVGLARLRERGRFQASQTTRALLADYKYHNNP
ncbi:MAG: DNA primase, partial [Deltaproteobacteria bacterium]|nr:DNA primase [Deltaproteobacteria bacterium]